MTPLAEVRAALTECADELSAMVKSFYTGGIEQRIHPAEQRRYERDMEPVQRARQALAVLSRIEEHIRAVTAERDALKERLDDIDSEARGRDW